MNSLKKIERQTKKAHKDVFRNKAVNRKLLFRNIYCPPTKLLEGNVFSYVFLSFCFSVYSGEGVPR